MRYVVSRASLFRGGPLAAIAAALLCIVPGLARAAPPNAEAAGAPALDAPGTATAARSAAPDSAIPAVPGVSVLRPLLTRHDEIAALEAVQIALTEIGDGATYVWFRHGGRISGAVHPTQSFKDAHGRVCRHLIVMLSDSSRKRSTEGIACRLADGGWELGG